MAESDKQTFMYELLFRFCGSKDGNFCSFYESDLNINEVRKFIEDAVRGMKTVTLFDIRPVERNDKEQAAQFGMAWYDKDKQENYFFIAWIESIAQNRMLLYSEKHGIVWHLRNYGYVMSYKGAAVFGEYTVSHPSNNLWSGDKVRIEKKTAINEAVQRINLLDLATCNIKIATRALRITTGLEWKYKDTFRPRVRASGKMKQPTTLYWQAPLSGEPKATGLSLSYDSGKSYKEGKWKVSALEP